MMLSKLREMQKNTDKDVRESTSDVAENTTKK